MLIPVSEPQLGKQELAYVEECMRTGWISSAGRFIGEFEQRWARYCGMNYGIAVSSGTAALEVAMRCLELDSGDEVIMPSFTIISCALAIINSGAKPVLVDADPRTWTIDVSKIEEKITENTKAIMPVHIYGHPCDMDKIRELAKRYNLRVVEDAAEAHGAEYRGQKCGGLGDLSCFSFYANKIITTGEGGMVLTNNADYAEKARSLRNLCFRNDRRFYHTERGYNFRLTNLQAAIGLAQLERIDELVEKKRWIGRAYSERLKGVSGIILPVEEPWAKNVYWMYGIVVDEECGLGAQEFGTRLRERGVETRPFFIGMHEQPLFKKTGLWRGECYPVTDRLARQGLYLPSGLTLTEKQVEEVCSAIVSILC